MITERLTNGNPETLNVMSAHICGVAKSTVGTEALCDCHCEDCLQTLSVFADTSSTDPKRNDKREFLFRVLDVGDTAVLKLFKNGTEVATLNTGAYGTYYALGSLGTGDQLFYTGYLIEWKNVLSAFGVGDYYIKAELTIYGSSVDVFSQIYTLMVYDEETVDGTVRIATYQNGNIESSEFDYTGLNWYQEIRIKGIFWQKRPELTKDTYFTTARKVTQIQDSIKFIYTLETQFLTGKTSDYLVSNKMLANDILITDYNRCNTESYLDLPVTIEEFENTEELSYFRGRYHTITFADRTQNIRKRNFK